MRMILLVVTTFIVVTAHVWVLKLLSDPYVNSNPQEVVLGTLIVIASCIGSGVFIGTIIVNAKFKYFKGVLNARYSETRKG